MTNLFARIQRGGGGEPKKPIDTHQRRCQNKPIHISKELYSRRCGLSTCCPPAKTDLVLDPSPPAVSPLCHAVFLSCDFSVFPSLCRSVSLFLSFCLSVSLSFCLSISCLSVFVSLCFSAYLMFVSLSLVATQLSQDFHQLSLRKVHIRRHSEELAGI